MCGPVKGINSIWRKSEYNIRCNSKQLLNVMWQVAGKTHALTNEVISTPQGICPCYPHFIGRMLIQGHIAFKWVSEAGLEPLFLIIVILLAFLHDGGVNI